jgi:hypothetical protein
MINSKETLKRLHKKFPLMTLDELFEILDCVVEESLFKYEPSKNTNISTQPWNGDKLWYDSRVLCSDNHSVRAYNGDLCESGSALDMK